MTEKIDIPALRALWEAATTHKEFAKANNAIPDLLDELEALRKGQEQSRQMFESSEHYREEAVARAEAAEAKCEAWVVAANAVRRTVEARAEAAELGWDAIVDATEAE